MRRFSPKLKAKRLGLGLAAAWMLALAAGAGAQQGPGAFEALHAGAVNLSGQQFLYDSKTDTFVATGNAYLTQGATLLTADNIQFQHRDQRAEATGQVHLLDPLIEIFAEKAQVDLENETLKLNNAKVFARNGTYRLEGAELSKLAGQHYAVRQGFFTTCGCARTPDWALEAEEIDAPMDAVGTAHNVQFDILGHPLLPYPIPALTFPTTSTRQSGFLGPRFGTSPLRGAQLFQPYFLNISKDSDATVAFDYESAQRAGLYGEYRLQNGIDDYLWLDAGAFNESFRSEANRRSDIIDTQLANPTIPINRWDLIGTMRQHLTPDLVLYGDALQTSDSLLFRELDVWTLSRGYGNNYPTMRFLPSHLGLLDSYDDGFVQLQGTWNQDLIQPQQFALQTLPSLWADGRYQLADFAYMDYNAQADYFWREQGVRGLRLSAEPSLTVPWRWGDYLYAYAGQSVYLTGYDVTGHQILVFPAGTHGRLYNNLLLLGTRDYQGLMYSDPVPYTFAKAATILERTYDLNLSWVEKLKNTIEPFVLYAYVPPINQSNLPLFDSLDRIPARSLITYGFTTRLFAKLPPSAVPQTTGLEMLEGPSQEQMPSLLVPTSANAAPGAGNIEELLELSVLEAYDTSYAFAPGGIRLSDVEANLSFLPTRLGWFGGSIDYDPRLHQRLDFASFYLAFQPWWTNNLSPLYMGKATVGSFLTMGYYYANAAATPLPSNASSAANFVYFETYYDILDWLGVYYAPSYDFAAKELLESSYGIRFKSPCNCWAVDLAVIYSINPRDVLFQTQVTLGGLGSTGSQPFARNPFQTCGRGGTQIC